MRFLARNRIKLIKIILIIIMSFYLSSFLFSSLEIKNTVNLQKDDIIKYDKIEISKSNLPMYDVRFEDGQTENKRLEDQGFENILKNQRENNPKLNSLKDTDKAVAGNKVIAATYDDLNDPSLSSRL